MNEPPFPSNIFFLLWIDEKCTSVDYFDTRKMPPIGDYYSSLTQKSISQTEYSMARRLWKKWRVKNMGEFALKYCILGQFSSFFSLIFWVGGFFFHFVCIILFLFLDVYLLAESFINYRNVIFKSFCLDPARFAFLLHSKQMYVSLYLSPFFYFTKIHDRCTIGLFDLFTHLGGTDWADQKKRSIWNVRTGN